MRFCMRKPSLKNILQLRTSRHYLIIRWYLPYLPPAQFYHYRVSNNVPKPTWRDNIETKSPNDNSCLTQLHSIYLPQIRITNFYSERNVSHIKEIQSRFVIGLFRFLCIWYLGFHVMISTTERILEMWNLQTRTDVNLWKRDWCYGNETGALRPYLNQRPTETIWKDLRWQSLKYNEGNKQSIFRFQNIGQHCLV